jgi:hypothetical protein
MFRHVVLLEFDDATSDDHIEQVAAQLREFPALMPVLRSYLVGRDLGLAPGNAHLAVVAEFDDIEGYITYRDHPTHRRVIDEMIVPHLRTRSAVQFQHDVPT